MPLGSIAVAEIVGLEIVTVAPLAGVSPDIEGGVVSTGVAGVALIALTKPYP
jgi:hypothetical protein